MAFFQKYIIDIAASMSYSSLNHDCNQVFKLENQRFEILKYASQKKIQIDQWIEEVVSGSMRFETGSLVRFCGASLKPSNIFLIKPLHDGKNFVEARQELGVSEVIINKWRQPLRN